MHVTINGEPHDVPDGIDLHRLIALLELRPEMVAVERNMELVRRADYASCALADGDRLEIVTLVGGG